MNHNAFLKLAVIGDPVAHSASPELHRGFLTEAGVDGSYEAIRVPSGAGGRVIRDLGAQGYRGLNVTTPLKEEALVACDRVPDPLAMLADSVNVILFQNDGIYGFNTDGIGALHSIADALNIGEERAKPSEVAGIRIAVLGVGPTARAALGYLKSHGAAVSLWNRTRERAEAAADRFDVKLWSGSPVDVVFSTLPPRAEIEDAVVEAARRAPIVIDANYGPRTTLADRLERSVVDGLGMLKHSALASFRIFSMSRQERIEETEHDVSPWLNP